MEDVTEILPGPEYPEQEEKVILRENEPIAVRRGRNEHVTNHIQYMYKCIKYQYEMITMYMYRVNAGV